MPRFFCPQDLTIGMTLELPEHIAHHIQVLRLQPGAVITLFNGQGGEFIASVVAIGKKTAQAEIKTFAPTEVELPYGLTLAQALPEGSKIDWIIEKAVELGATAIQPLAAQRCVVRLNPERAEKKQAHWKGIIQAAAEQSGRNRLTHLADLIDFKRWITQNDMHKRILLSPRGEQSLSDWARHHPPQAVTLLVGPEGGFSNEEEQLACENGALMLAMGPRVLRTETAGLSALAAINAIWGEM
jgi:16S rRNA (uracil1498-N3)-methyltransferase